MINRDIRVTYMSGCNEKVLLADNLTSYSEELRYVCYNKTEGDYNNNECIYNVFVLEMFENNEWVVVFKKEKPAISKIPFKNKLRDIRKEKEKLIIKVDKLKVELGSAKKCIDKFEKDIRDLNDREKAINSNMLGLYGEDATYELIWKSK